MVMVEKIIGAPEAEKVMKGFLHHSVKTKGKKKHTLTTWLDRIL